MDGAGSVIRRIDVERIDADESDASFDERQRQVASEMRMAFEVLIGSPVRVPTGMNEERFALQGRDVDRQPVDRAIPAVGQADDDAIKIGKRFEFQLGKVFATGIAMEGRIQIGASVRDHFDLADLEFGPGRITCARRFAAEVIANDRRGKTFVSYHPVLDGVAQVDEFSVRHLE